MIGRRERGFRLSLETTDTDPLSQEESTVKEKRTEAQEESECGMDGRMDREKRTEAQQLGPVERSELVGE